MRGFLSFIRVQLHQSRSYNSIPRRSPQTSLPFSCVRTNVDHLVANFCLVLPRFRFQMAKPLLKISTHTLGSRS